MKNRMKRIVIISAIIASCTILLATLFFINDVKSLLWQKSVTDIMEITQQGSRSLDTYIEKDFENLKLFSGELEHVESTDEESIEKNIKLFDTDTTDFYCTNLKTGKTYSSIPDAVDLSEEERQKNLNIEGRGLAEPVIDPNTGVKMIHVYQRFQMRDGVEAIAVKARTIMSIADSFSLSFYQNQGFSYIVDMDGNVLIRSTHQNSNRTFQNLFDIIEMDGNDKIQIDSFKNDLNQKVSGVAKFQYQKDDYVYCYVPLKSQHGWYVISIIPNSVIMQQAENIIFRAIALCVLILFLFVLFGYFYRLNNQQHQKEIEKLAFYDDLTGLYRYEKFLLDGNKKLAEGKQYAICYIDIIGFKLLNDVEGYVYGDRVLNYIADVIRDIDSKDAISCRVAGDDFLLMCQYQSRKQMMKLCQDIVAKASIGLDKNRPLKISIGICLKEDIVMHNITMNAMVDRARMAQKTIRENASKPFVFYNKEMHNLMLRDMEMERIMKQALVDGEFIYLIQPKYAVDGSRILGGEALVRWCHEGRYISPGEFIPLFERNGFIRSLDEYVFVKVCEDMQKRIQENLPVVPVSVNVSRVHLFWENFVDTYISIKEQYQIPDGLIELELTENILLHNTKDTFAVMERLKQHGFICSIDDFGSGYSSLNMLKSLPVDVIKLDRVFFDENKNVKNVVILKSMISMAKQLSMKVVAEGIETEEQLALLDGTGCDMIQGYIYAKPLDVTEFYARLDAK